MLSAILANGIDLDSWAKRLYSHGFLPQVVRRLIFATVGRAERIDFRAGEGIHIRGWDGTVAVKEGNAFVPDGISAWELSNDSKSGTKATNDYKNRLKKPLEIDPSKNTFVFLTARRWAGKNDWAAEKKRAAAWKDVRAYDADDLETWLETAPAVHIWLSLLLGKHTEGVEDLDTFWTYWSGFTHPSTSLPFILSGRNEVADKIQAWLRDSFFTLLLRGESKDESLGVFAAAMQKLPLEEREIYISRAVVVRSLSAWQFLASSAEPLIMIPLFDVGAAIAMAKQKGHRVVIPLGSADSETSNTITIPRLSREEAQKALEESGVPERDSRDLAALAHRSFASFRRKTALSPELQQPLWARGENPRHLLPAMLAGAWNNKLEGDCRALAQLAQKTYQELSGILVRWSNEDDPPVRFVGDTWFIASKEDAWLLLGRYITQFDLELFERVVLDVLGNYEPRFDLPEDQRWMANVLGHASPYSRSIREGLADTVACMGVRGSSILVSSGVSASDYAMRIVRQLLERADSDWRIWASLAPLLPLIAEAAPDIFLQAIERGLSGERPILLSLFTDKEESSFGSSSPHTGLLWALETLAWSPEHLGSVTLILAKLTRLDPGGKLANRPERSLHNIFLFWHPQTSADLDRRLRILRMMYEREPEVTARVIRGLLPDMSGIAENTVIPRWHDWSVNVQLHIMQAEYYRAIRETLTIMIDLVDASGTGWTQLIEALTNLPSDLRTRIIDRLVEVDIERLSFENRRAIWDALRKFISRHRSFPDAGWALPPMNISQLEALYERLQPPDLLAKFSWLFSPRPELLEGHIGHSKAYGQAITTRRIDAVRSVLGQAGFQGLLDLALAVESPFELGATIGRSDLCVENEDSVLSQYLASGNDARAILAQGLVSGRLQSQGRNWGESKLFGPAITWTIAQKAILLTFMPADKRTWEHAEIMGEEIGEKYWKTVAPYWIDNKDDIELAARKLIEYARPYTAIDLLAMASGRMKGFSSEIIIKSLELALTTPPESDPAPGNFPYNVSELLEMLGETKGIDEDKLALLEWAYLPILTGPLKTPNILHQKLAKDAKFFAEIVSLVFRAKGDEPRDLTAEEETKAKRGYDLLRSWRAIPGTTEGGAIDISGLMEWIQAAREHLTGMRLIEIGDEMIGQVLSGSPSGSDEVWPHPAVCEVIERVASRELERGFELGTYNARGITTRGDTEGGIQERQLQDRFKKLADAICDRWPRAVAILRRIAASYGRESHAEDQEAELQEDLDD
jgi:hypothetical protein